MRITKLKSVFLENGVFLKNQIFCWHVKKAVIKTRQEISVEIAELTVRRH